MFEAIANSLAVTGKVLNFVLFCFSSEHFRDLLRQRFRGIRVRKTTWTTKSGIVFAKLCRIRGCGQSLSEYPLQYYSVFGGQRRPSSKMHSQTARTLSVPLTDIWQTRGGSGRGSPPPDTRCMSRCDSRCPSPAISPRFAVTRAPSPHQSGERSVSPTPIYV